jgi:hypothetical protein
MALTLEPNLRQTNALYDNITVEDFMEVMDRVRPEETPMWSMARREMDLTNTTFAWNVDTLPTPNGALGVADGEAAPTGNIRDVTSNIRKMGNVGQGVRRSYGAGWISQKVPNIAGLGKGNIIARGRADAYILGKQDFEVAFCSTDQKAYTDTGSGTGSLMAGFRNMVDKVNQYSAASGFAYGQPTDIQYAPTGASITGSSQGATFNLSSVRSVTKALRQSAALKMDYVFLAGLSMREAVTYLTDPTTQTATGATGSNFGVAAGQVRAFQQNIDDGVFKMSVRKIETDWGAFLVMESRMIGTTTTNSTGGAVASSGNRATRVYLENLNAAYMFPRDQIFKRIGVPFYETPLPDSGGGPTYDVKGLAALGVGNPMYCGFYVFTGA